VLRWVGGVRQIGPSVACGAVRFLRGRRQRVKAHDNTSHGINDIVYCNVKTVQMDDVGPTGPDSLKFLQFAEQVDNDTARDCDVERKIPPCLLREAG
jgi:hypothetical protein